MEETLPLPYVALFLILGPFHGSDAGASCKSDCLSLAAECYPNYPPSCCSGAECLLGVDQTHHYCCLSNSQSCYNNNDRCSGNCASGTCTCAPLNAPCQAGSVCCTGTCTAGVSAESCTPTGQTCSALPCCAGECGGGKCTCKNAGQACSVRGVCCSLQCNGNVCT